MKIGIDLGGSHIAVGVVDNNNELIEKVEKDFSEEDKMDIITVTQKFIVENVKIFEENYEIESIGIAVPGVAKNGVIIKTVNLGINNYDIKSSLEEKLQKKVNVRNDGKCACIAEFKNLIKEDKTIENANILFLTIGTGIGGGVIYNGKLLEGHTFEGYELGHMIIKANGIPCKCGKSGCFERYGSILEYKNKVKQRLNISKDINGKPLRDLIKSRKNEILDINEQYISDLAIGISNLINIFEPDLIVIGGGFVHYSSIFENDLKDNLLKSTLLFNRRNNIDIRYAKLENDAGIIGATIETEI